MNVNPKEPFFAFVWRHSEIGPATIDAARQTSTRAIYDLSGTPPTDVATALKSAGAKDVKVSADILMNSDLPDWLERTGIETLWVEYHAAVFNGALDVFINRLDELSARCTCIPVISDYGFLDYLIKAEQRPMSLALKGSEASGFVGSESIGVLFATYRQKLEEYSLPLDVCIWGGVATPEGAAAFLACGAKGVVFESLHWQTDLVDASPVVRGKVAKLRPEQSTVIGVSLGVPCRLFDKGNSLGLKMLTNETASLIPEMPPDELRKTFVQRVVKETVPALESEFDRREIIPLGPEAAFAEAFAERFGRSTITALGGFRSEVFRLLGEAERVKEHFQDSEAAQELGTKYPFIQGAMTWISEVPEFAMNISEAGGLPTVALGLKDPLQLADELGQLKDVMGDRPYALNCMALPENPYLEGQLKLLEKIEPPFVVIAAGEPSHAGRLIKKGIEVIYIAPDEGLMLLAFKLGVRWVVLEGNEAGGHVGALTTLTLAQMALELKRREPELLRDRRLILAGGIYNRQTAFWAAMLGADAVQMGTVYLSTNEIVSSGALTRLYQEQIIESSPGSTVISGESIGLRVRALKTPKMDAILAVEREAGASGEEESSLRGRLEKLAAGSLFVAAKGLEAPGGKPVDGETYLKEGQFMSGAVAGAVNHVTTAAELHRDLAEGPIEIPSFSEAAGSAGPSRQKVARSDDGKERVAITGWAQVNSLGNSPREIWEAGLALKTGIVEVSSSNWDHSMHYDPNPGTSEKTYCNVAAFQNIELTRKELGIPPQDWRTMAKSTKLTMFLAKKAIQDSQILSSDIPRERIAVIVSQNSGETASTLEDLTVSTLANELVLSLKGVIPPELEAPVLQRLKDGRIVVDDTTLLGRLNCAAGGFICNKYGFNGPSYSVTAACATSQVALFTAIQMIRNGLIDAALIGGGEELLTAAHFIEFSALGALAQISGVKRPPAEVCRPFDAERDGMVLGEGGAMILIERESVAKKRGARIHAYITGVGASNSDQGMVESVAGPQQIAIRASFRDTGYDPTTIDLVECHATATVQGDVEEVKALKGFFPKGKRTILASFKSQIGHTLGSSGLNSMIRGIGALKNGVLPGTLNYRTPDPKIALEEWGFTVLPQPSEWPDSDNRPKRIMVNSFGFGGANYVVQLEECRDGKGVVLVSDPSAETTTETRTDASAGSGKKADIQGVVYAKTYIGGGPYRLGILADSAAEARAKVAEVDPIEGPLTDKIHRILDRLGIYIGPEDDAPLPLSIVFAGQGTSYPGMGGKLYDAFPLIREWMDRIAALAEFDLLEIMFRTDGSELKNTLWQQPALYCLEYAMVQQLWAMGVRPVAMAGHSMGELTALSVSGVVSWDDGFRIINKRAQCMDKAAGLSLDPGVMIAVDAPHEVLEKKIAERENVYFTNYNSPRQVVLGGGTEEGLALMEELKAEGYWTVQLKVSMAFHSPVMATIRGEMAEFVSGIDFKPPRIPVISNTTMKPYPDEADEIRKIIMAHLERPVHWRQNVETLWNDYGARVFLEVGPKATLCNLISETVDQAKCINSCHPDDEVLAFRGSAARLYTQGQIQPTGLVPQMTFAVPAQTQAVVPLSAAMALSGDGDRVTAIVQREINTFVLESFGRILKPAILEAIRREVDPGYNAERLDGLLGGTPTPVGPAAGYRQAPGLPERTAPESAARAEPAAEKTPKPEPGTRLSDNNYLERIIQIIMDATGYERDEIEPEMDIRTDLAIRSSRLPVIMDAAERQFGITIKLEDFIGVRTVQAMADRIAEVVARAGAEPPTVPVSAGEPLAPPVETAPEPDEDQVRERTPLKRLVFRETPLPEASPNILNLADDRKVAILSCGVASSLAAEASNFFKHQMKAKPLLMDIMGKFDLRTPEGGRKAAKRLEEVGPLTGLVLVLDNDADAALKGPEDVSALLSGLFQCLQGLIRSPEKALCLMITKGLDPNGSAAVACEGVLGMFLAASHEYSSVMFRTAVLDGQADVKAALNRMLDTAHRRVEMVFRGSEAFNVKCLVQPASIAPEPRLRIKPGDVIVISGGGRGITAGIAAALAPYQPRLILLGRSPADLPSKYMDLAASDEAVEEAALRVLEEDRPDLKGEALESEVAGLTAALSLARTMDRLKQSGGRCGILHLRRGR